jgi:hypothetical protein
VQTGNDATFEGRPTPVMSSGGFTQMRYEINRRLFALARYDRTNTPGAGISGDFVTLLGYRVSRNSRLTLENVTQRVPATTNTLNLQYTVGI